MDWFDPNSPLITDFETKANIDRFFIGSRVLTGAGKVFEERAAQFGDSEKTKQRARVPTSFIVKVGMHF